MSVPSPENLPLILAGPILRKCTSKEVVWWIASKEPLNGSLSVYQGETLLLDTLLEEHSRYQVGKHAWVTLVQINGQFPTDVELSYDLHTDEQNLATLAPHLLYQGEERPRFTITDRADYILHGSCRAPHAECKDALVAADSKVASTPIHERPDMLLMSGDQIYADHVAGPLLNAITHVVDALGLMDEILPAAPIDSMQALHHHGEHLYGRQSLLPKSDSGWLGGKANPIFSSKECVNHLITFSEFFAMYLLVWSPAMWSYLVKRYQNPPMNLTASNAAKWREEMGLIDKFVSEVPFVARLMAHIPTYMIFDDHDVTDDWNLTIGWEKAAYQNPFAHRIIGNGLISYWLCQAWGNQPSRFNEEFHRYADNLFTARRADAHSEFVEYLYQFERWHYTTETSPKVVVLDTRTRRWRSESKMNKPSGLMDWEALIEFQQQLLHQDKVVVVSPAPMFGVKFIEALQRLATWLGQPLVIDAENWMAHPGSANTLLSIFTHTKTPTNFVILSGDVHYSFAYDIELRYRKSSPNIYQITCSGFKNQFPEPLLSICDTADTLLYSPRSPLNLFTKRKRLRIKKRTPTTRSRRKLVNQSAIGELKLSDTGEPSYIGLLTGESTTVEFQAISDD